MPVSLATSRVLALAVLCSVALVNAAPPAAHEPPRREAEVIVLSSLHQYQPRVRNYGYAELSKIVELLAPEVLALELSAEDIAERRPQRIKREYPEGIYPLLDRRPFITVPLEPSEPLRSDLVASLRRSERAFALETPERAQAFGVYTERLFEFLLDRWRSACDVNSGQTDALLAAKHRLQDAIAPPEQAAAWEAWNQHFLHQIRQAVRSYPGKRIVVIAGVEHGFWLRERLSKEPNMKLLDTADQLQATVCTSITSSQPPSR
jgi:hypothetical protein